MNPPSATPFDAARREWLETDGRGGFASGTVTGVRTRRYHALLIVAASPPTGRVAMVSGFDAVVTTPAGSYALSTQHYAPDVIHPDGWRRIINFDPQPWPRWSFRLEDGTRLEHEILMAPGVAGELVAWRLAVPRAGVTLALRPFFAGRDYHALQHENRHCRFDPEACGGAIVWQIYDGIPSVSSLSNGSYTHEPDWYRNFVYTDERDRGLDYAEDLATPGTFSFDLSRGEALWLLRSSPDRSAFRPVGDDEGLETAATRLRQSEKRRRSRFKSWLGRAADSYIVERGAGKTIIAGYPWFADWGRDTFIAMRGLCLAGGRLADAAAILTEWSETVSDGMLPNRFPDSGTTPEFNSVDASLWYIVAIGDFLSAMDAAGRKLPAARLSALLTAVDAIVTGYSAGTRYNIHADSDGLLAAGEPGQQLTWMDARAGDWVVTPRIGKPVEVQALWINALTIASALSVTNAARWRAAAIRARESFARRFWNPAGGYLYDVVDVDHQPGTADATFRPNQVFAVGGLPYTLLDGAHARMVVDAVETRLLTPLGLRSLARSEPNYAPRYAGGPRDRDAAYHQGTVWPWLIGPFVEAWLRVHGHSEPVRAEARRRFLEPLLKHLEQAGLGHISEIADGDPPHTPRGCPFQAWSLGEVLRMNQLLLDQRTIAPESLG